MVTIAVLAIVQRGTGALSPRAQGRFSLLAKAWCQFELGNGTAASASG